MNNLNKSSALIKNSNDYKMYEKLEEKMKDLKCGNSDEIEYMNEYLYSLENVHWELLENVQDKTGKSKPRVCSMKNLNCKSINKTVESTKKTVSWPVRGLIKKNIICSNLIPRHFKLLLTLKKNKDKLNDHNIDLYQHISTNFVNLLIKLKLIKYARCLDSNHPNVQEITPNEALYGGKKTKKIATKNKTLEKGGKEDFGTYKDGSSVFKDKNGYYVNQWDNVKQVEYKKYLKSWKPVISDTRLILDKKTKKWKIVKSKKTKTTKKPTTKNPTTKNPTTKNPTTKKPVAKKPLKKTVPKKKLVKKTKK